MFFNSLIQAIRDLIRDVRNLAYVIRNLNVAVEELQETAADLTVVLRRVAALRMPGLVFLKIVSEESDMLFFVLTLPPKGATDVVSRELTVKIGDADAVTVNPGVDDTESQEFSGADGASVTGSLVEIDDATPANRSEVRTFEFTLTDTFAPPQPGEVGIRVTREE